MAAITRTDFKMATQLPSGLVGPIQFSRAVSAAIDTGPTLVQVATGVTNQAVRIFGTQGITTATVVFISSDQDVSVIYNGSSQPLLLSAGGYQVLAGTSITTMGVTNNSGLTANLTIWLAGV